MENPGTLIRRARLSRGLRPRAIVDREQENPKPSAVPRYATGHASYTALMRSHDRVHTRHITGKG